MKDFYIRHCATQENQTITSSFVVASKQVKAKKSGEPYLALSLADRSGTIEAKVWDNVGEVLDAFEQDDVIKVKGLLNRYNNRWQLTIHKLRRMEEAEADFADYLQVDRDLLLTGVFVHDIGKVHELSYGRSFSYTTRGQLLGHMIIELEMLHAKIATIDGSLSEPFPAELKTLLEHLIISHHGHYEFGSPKLPMFPEALLLHYLDDLDSKMKAMRAHFEREPLDEWTSYNASLGRP